MDQLQNVIENAWDDRSLLENTVTQTAIREVVEMLDRGTLRVAQPTDNGWVVNEWIKKAVVLYFPIQKMETIECGPLEFHDKIPLKRGYAEKGIRVVPHAVARHGAYISRGVIMMPSYINIGAHVEEPQVELCAWNVRFFTAAVRAIFRPWVRAYGFPADR